MVFVVLKTDGGLICSLVATPLMCVRKTCSISKGSLDLELCYVYGSVNNVSAQAATRRLAHRFLYHTSSATPRM